MADEFTRRVSGGLITGCDDGGAPTTDHPTTPAPPPPTPAQPDPTTPAAADPPDTAEPATGADTAATDTHPDGGANGSLNVHLHLVMTDTTLLDGDDEPAELIGYGLIPATLARRIAATHLGAAATTWLRRLFTHPHTGQLAAMDSRSRDFPDTLKQFVLARDRRCRIPYCGAPARHTDHVISHAQGGPTSAANGQAASADCNWTKEADGWTSTTDPNGTITITTPTGHTYPSPQPHPPRPPGWTTTPHGGDPTWPAPTTEHPHQDEPAAFTPNADDPEWKRRLDAAFAGQPLMPQPPPKTKPSNRHPRRRPITQTKPTRLRPPPVNKARSLRRIAILKS